MPRLRRFVCPLILATAVFAAPVPALAQEDQIVVRGRQMPSGYGPVYQTVKISDLDLKSRAGVTTMQRRVTSAVQMMCRIVPPASAAKQRESRTCREFAWASARPQMDRAVQMATRR